MQKSIHSAQYAAFLTLLRATRKRAGLTQVEAAKRLGETQTFISKCERGERRLDVVELWAFCKAYEFDFSEFTRLLDQKIRRIHRST